MASAKKARKLRQRAKHLLKRAGATATHAAKGKKAKLSAACATALKDAARAVWPRGPLGTRAR